MGFAFENSFDTDKTKIVANNYGSDIIVEK